jgi:hypothetical protein
MGQGRWVTRWKLALNTVALTFAGRMPAAETSGESFSDHR